jgi:hypothetical protein
MKEFLLLLWQTFIAPYKMVCNLFDMEGDYLYKLKQHNNETDSSRMVD